MRNRRAGASHSQPLTDPGTAGETGAGMARRATQGLSTAETRISQALSGTRGRPPAPLASPLGQGSRARPGERDPSAGAVAVALKRSLGIGRGGREQPAHCLAAVAGGQIFQPHDTRSCARRPGGREMRGGVTWWSGRCARCRARRGRGGSPWAATATRELSHTTRDGLGDRAGRSRPGWFAATQIKRLAHASRLLNPPRGPTSLPGKGGALPTSLSLVAR